MNGAGGDATNRRRRRLWGNGPFRVFQPIFRPQQQQQLNPRWPDTKRAVMAATAVGRLLDDADQI